MGRDRNRDGERSMSTAQEINLQHIQRARTMEIHTLLLHLKVHVTMEL
jgi:hypothetical protein